MRDNKHKIVISQPLLLVVKFWTLTSFLMTKYVIASLSYRFWNIGTVIAFISYSSENIGITIAY
jgi:hypothetical protein